MSVCNEGFEAYGEAVGYCPMFEDTCECGGCLCLLSQWDEHEEFDGLHHPPDTCPFAPLLKALPDASEEILRIAEALLRGYGDVQFYTSPGYRRTVFSWTQRDKEA